MCVCVFVCVHCFSHVRLFATPWTVAHQAFFAIPWTVAHQAPLSTGLSRQEYWRGLPLPTPGDLPNPGIEPTSLTSPALAGRFFTTSATWEAPPWQPLVYFAPLWICLFWSFLNKWDQYSMWLSVLGPLTYHNYFKFHPGGNMYLYFISFSGSIIPFQEFHCRTSLVVQWLRLSIPNAGGSGSIPGQGTKTPHAMQCGQKMPSKPSLVHR